MRILRWLSLPVATAAMASTLCVPASAATFTVTSCTDSVPNRAWGLNTSRPDLLEGLFTCPPGTGRTGGLVAQERLVSPSTTPTGNSVEWRFTAPAGATVTGLSLDRWLAVQVDPGWISYIRTAEGLTIESCRAPAGPSVTCEIGAGTAVLAAPDFDPETFTGLQTTGLVVGVACDTASPGGCSNGSPGAPGAQHQVGAGARNIIVTLSENSPPALDAVAGAAGPGVRWIGGQPSVEVTASDIGSGVANARVLEADGSMFGSAAATCDQQARPCPSPATLSVPIDTRALPDGPATLRAVVTDAAGLTATGTPWTVEIDNTPPVAPTEDSTARPFTTTRPIPVQFPSTGSPVVTATWRVRPSNGGPAIATGRASSLSGLSALGIRIPRVGDWRVEYDLRDAAGNAAQGLVGSEVFVGPPPRVRGRALLLPMPFRTTRSRWNVGIRIGATLIRRRVLVPANASRIRVPLPSGSLSGRTVTARWRLVAGGPSYSTRIRVPQAPLR